MDLVNLELVIQFSLKDVCNIWNVIIEMEKVVWSLIFLLYWKKDKNVSLMKQDRNVRVNLKAKVVLM